MQNFASGVPPASLIEELIPPADLDQMPPDLFARLVRDGDQHVACIIFDPFFEKNPWVFNLPYPAGKKPGYGLIGGRSESFGAQGVDGFIQKNLKPSIQKLYRRTFARSRHQWTEPAECVAVREAFEETQIKIRILLLAAEGAVLNRDYRVMRILKTIRWLKQRFSQDPTTDEITANLKKMDHEEALAYWDNALSELRQQTGRAPLHYEIMADLRRRNDDESRPYWRSIFICVAMNHGDEMTQAVSEDGKNLQTRGFKWFSANELPPIEGEFERIEREKRDESPPDFAYYKHVHTFPDPRIQYAIHHAKLRAEADAGAEPGEDIATLRYLWKLEDEQRIRAEHMRLSP